jgi:hypothetical protein
MRIAEYSKGLNVTKRISNRGWERFGVTVSDAAYKSERAEGWFCLVQWSHTTRPEETSLFILKEVEEKQLA